MKQLQLSVILIIFYMVFYVQAYNPVTIFLITTCLFMDIMLLYYNYKLRLEGGLLKELSYEGKAYLAFYVLIFLPGLIYSPSAGLYLGNIKNGIQYAILFIAVYYIVKQKKSMDFPLISLGIAIYAYALTAFFSGSLQGVEQRLVVSESGNPNTLAVYMYIGIILVLYFWNKGFVYKILSMIYIPIALLNIIQSGSRKGLIGTLLFILLFLILECIPLINKQNILKVIISFLLFLIIIFSFYKWYLPIFTDSILYDRLLRMNNAGNLERLNMYREAFNLFKESPIFGIGYMNFKYLSSFGTYSHSTYAEVLASSGIVGAIIYFSIYVSIIYKLIKLYVVKAKQKVSVYFTGILLSYMLVNLFYAAVEIDLYDPVCYVLFACIAGYYEINKKCNDSVMTMNRIYFIK